MRGRRGKLKAQAAWSQAWNNYFGEHVKEEDIQPGFRFVFHTGDFHLTEVWYEVIEQEWDWRVQENVWVVWNEKTEDLEIWDVASICQVGHKKGE
jgi:hypothetical protein